MRVRGRPLLLLGAMAIGALAARSALAQDADLPDLDKVAAGAKAHAGLLTLHHRKDKLFLELPPAALGKEYLFLPSLSRGIGDGMLLGGMSLNFGDDWVLTFERVANRIHVIRKNVRFQAKSGTPAEEAVKRAYGDSVVLAIPIVAKTGGGVVIDLAPICMTDFLGLAPILSGTLGGPFSFDPNRSAYTEVKAFPKNVEIQVDGTFGGNSAGESDTVPDKRGVKIGMHFSISELPKNNGYRPRKADPRIGYFLTVAKDYTVPTDDTPFVRYINRWHLEKADASASPSPPKEPIIFHIEKTVPFKWRPYVVEGILGWNRAYDKLGFANAVQVRDLPDGADPEDVRYNTFRWITTGQGFAMGPSRVNPRTGQILDADIIFDSDMIRYWQMEFDDIVRTKETRTRGPVAERPTRDWCSCQDCAFGPGMRTQLGLIALTHLAVAADGKTLPDTVIGQAVREVTMHEVGHTLGLRHNFKASTWKTLEQINAAKPDEAIVASVMDYSPANIQPKGKPQGSYFSPVIGPYDEWVIEYGYSVLSPDKEEESLKKIASRAAEPALTYATDEDTRGIDPDPLTHRFDLGADPVAYSKLEVELVKSLLPDLTSKIVKDGDSYEKLRRAFGMLLGTHLRAGQRVLKFIGGQEMHRHFKGDPNGKAPFVVTPAAKQREALAFLRDNLFDDKAFVFPPELLNALAPSRWEHWGTRPMTRLEFPLHDIVFRFQKGALEDLLYPLALERLIDVEQRFPKGAETFTAAELFRQLSAAIWGELDAFQPGQKPMGRLVLTSFRRALQREYVRQLISLRLEGGVPEDARNLASLQLRELDTRIAHALPHAADDYARAHLVETQDRVKRALTASFLQFTP